MTFSYIALLEAMLEERGVSLPSERVAAAAATREKLRHEFDKLRAVDLTFLPPYLEPATALRWIEHYGSSDEEDEHAAR
jgi:hypothetical protein